MEMRTEMELREGEAPLLRRQERDDSLRQKRRFLDFESQRNRIGKTTTRSEQNLLLKRFEQCGVASVFVILIVESIFLREENNSKRSREKEKYLSCLYFSFTLSFYHNCSQYMNKYLFSYKFSIGKYTHTITSDNKE
jgi:hypothetical protein